MFGLHVYMCTAWVPNGLGGQKMVMGLLELEGKMAVSLLEVKFKSFA